jgi:hypothetical protein
MRTEDRTDIERIIAAAEANAVQSMPQAADRKVYPVLQEKPDQAIKIFTDALPGLAAHKNEFDRLVREHDSDLRRVAADARQRAIDGAAAAAKRLNALANTQREALQALPIDPLNPSSELLLKVDFIRSWPTPGNLVESRQQPGVNWAKYRVRDSQGATRRRKSEKVSFYNYWQNPRNETVLAGILVRMTANGHCACHADWGGVASWFFPDSESRIDVSARLTIWGLWTDPAPQIVVDTVPLGGTSARGGFFGAGNQTTIGNAPAVSTAGFAIPARASILIEASLVVDYEMLSGSVDADFGSENLFQAGWAYAYVTLPPIMGMSP